MATSTRSALVSVQVSSASTARSGTMGSATMRTPPTTSAVGSGASVPRRGAALIPTCLVVGARAAGTVAVRPAEDPVAADSVAGDSVAGDSVAGDSVAGDSVAGDSVAGDSVAGDVVAGDVVAGDLRAVDVVATDKGAAASVAVGVVADDLSRVPPRTRPLVMRSEAITLLPCARRTVPDRPAPSGMTGNLPRIRPRPSRFNAKEPAAPIGRADLPPQLHPRRCRVSGSSSAKMVQWRG